MKSDVQKAVGETGPAASARQAADFVAQSAESAQASIALIGTKYPLLPQIGFAACIAAFYFFAFLSIVTIAAFPLPLVFLAVACGIALAIARLSDRQSHHPVLVAAAWPVLWVANKLSQIFARVRQLKLPSADSFDENAAMSLLAIGCFILACLLIWNPLVALVLLAISFVVARIRITRQGDEPMSRFQWWCVYPPMLIVLWSIAAIVVLAPPAVLGGVMAENNHDVSQFLVSAGGSSSGLTTIAFTVATVLVLFFVWLAALLVIARAARPVVKFLASPLLRDWNGRWMLTGALTCIVTALIFAMVSWSIAVAP